MSVSIIGAGAFGTGLAIAIARGGTPVILWARNADSAKAIAADRINPRLSDALLPKNVSVSAQLGDALTSETVLLAIPMQQLATFFKAHSQGFSGKRLVACCKGVDSASLSGPTSVMVEHVPTASVSILTGPSFAADIAKGLPTALTLACADDLVGASLQKQLSTSNLRLYRTTDVIGAELGGALKNVIAIACGISMGAGLGESARAALMTRGYAEMKRLSFRLGALPETMSGLSGFGDLALTCTSSQSRNYQFGISLGQNSKFDPSITVEGAKTAKAVSNLAQRLGIDMPITSTITRLLDSELNVTQAIDTLLARPLGKE